MSRFFHLRVIIPQVNKVQKMFKSVIAALAAAPLFAGAALAGPYVNVEVNASYPDGDYSSAVTDLHVGLEGGSGKVGYYVQGGPAFVHSEILDDTETELSGKVGLSYAATEDLGIYGELAGMTAGEDSDSALSSSVNILLNLFHAFPKIFCPWSKIPFLKFSSSLIAFACFFA